ncbi:ATP-dependent RNA helicase DDX42-like [Carassius carassius]|uniref:ATP-dependent RNA helicase DDX42-like n=1 Tax=Carassius carassius TaxID=217509 RepID=UPI0028692B7B|nr:ATP-dependent RNA helicase DDX42-like [Carassius carassius]
METWIRVRGTKSLLTLKKNLPVLVATDVAAQGLDIPSIRTVVNYDVARDIDTHTHRIGRTGHAGEKGLAYTLLTTKDTSFAGDLVRNLEGANQSVSKELMDLAMQNPWFRKSGKKPNIGGGGLGYRERPGLGSESDLNIYIYNSAHPPCYFVYNYF